MHVLTKNGFANIGEVVDSEDGLVWRWERTRPKKTAMLSKRESQMAVPISIRCPHCQAKLKLPSEKLLGKKLPCPKCKTTIVLKAPSKAKTIEDPGNVTRCPHCNAKLKLPSKKVAGKTLLCPKCKTAIVLKAVSEHESVTQVKSSADTHPDIDELSQTQTQIPLSAEQSSKPATSPNVSLGGLSGELVPLDEDEQLEESQRREADKKADGEGLYRLSSDRIPSSPKPKPIEVDDDEWDDSFDETGAEAVAQAAPGVEATPDELDLMDALEGLAKQEKSQPTRRRKKTTKGPTGKRKHR